MAEGDQTKAERKQARERRKKDRAGGQAKAERPTFNRLPVPANSSYDLVATGIRGEPVERWRTELEPDVVATIEERTLDLYGEVLALADLS
jgi:hypothetical protein